MTIDTPDTGLPRHLLGFAAGMTGKKVDHETMNEEIDDVILESELADDALEKKMRKLEADATRILHQSNELLREMRKGKENQEEAVQETIALQDMEEDKVS